MVPDPLKVTTDEVLIILHKGVSIFTTAGLEIGRTHESPRPMCGRANFAIAIIWMILVLKTSSVLSRSISANSLHMYCFDALLTSTLTLPKLYDRKSQCIVTRDEGKYSLILCYMLLHCLAAKAQISQIALNKKALDALLLNQSFGGLRVHLLFWEEDNADISSLSCHENSHRAANSGAEMMSIIVSSLRSALGLSYSPPVIKTFFPFNFPEPTYSTKSPSPSNLLDSLGNANLLSRLGSIGLINPMS